MAEQRPNAATSRHRAQDDSHTTSLSKSDLQVTGSTAILTEALFIMAKIWKLLKCLLMDEWIKR